MPSPHKVDPLRINQEKIIADLLLADANKAMASLFTDIRRLRRLLARTPTGKVYIDQMVDVLNNMERKLAP